MLADAWHTLYAAQKQHRLATAGMYARIRHPQYVAFIIIMVGFLFQWPTLVTLAMFPILVWVYVRLARREEAASEAEFGEEWRAYAKSVPAFIPRAWPEPYGPSFPEIIEANHGTQSEHRQSR